MAFTSDLRHSVRLLGRSPVFTITSVISLALGIGAAAAIFSLTDALLFEPTIGVRNASELVDIGRANQASGFDNMTHPTYKYIREHSRTLEIAAVDFGGGPMSLGVNGTSERVIGTLVSGNYFSVLGTNAALGRFFRDDEDHVPGERPVAVLSHALWTRRFNSDATILDRPLILQSFDDTAAIGLLPQKLAAWIAGSVGTIGIFLAALGLYGLMAFLVAQRTREIAIRMALGASARDMRSMVLRQAAWLAAIGGVVGLVLAGAIGTLAQSLLVGVPPIDPVAFGGTVVLFAIVLALAAWTPARRAAATDPVVALRAE